MVENPNWQEADQLAIYKRGREVKLGATEKQLQLAVGAGLEPGTSGFQIRRPNHSTTLPHCVSLVRAVMSVERLKHWLVSQNKQGEMGEVKIFILANCEQDKRLPPPPPPLPRNRLAYVIQYS